MNELINDINARIDRAFTDTLGYVRIMSYGIAEPVLVRDDEQQVTVPAVVTDYGECFNVFDNTDEHDIICYHRINSTSFAESGGYGSTPEYTQESQVSLVLYGKRTIGKYMAVDIVSRELLAMKNVRLVGVDYDAIQILASEYAGLPYFLGPDYFLVRVNYRLTTRLSIRCKK